MTSKAHALLTAIGIVVIRRRVRYEEVLVCQRLQWAEDAVRGLDIELSVPEESSGIWTVAVSD